MRPIDADVLFDFLTDQLEKEAGAYRKGRNAGLNIARSALHDKTITPTITPPPNPPLTLEELRELALDSLAVWCADTNGIAQGLLFMRENWSDSQISPHICLLDEEGNPGIYHVAYMVELGAKFYRRKPEEGAQ